ncbi:MAG: type II toxin-antitoxin system RelB/DinJ family antitoxin [Oscillospiraceae bacterium]|nr:type II toxin-antitoxin system RelB/DinJ family antitoxin [Oscillospiraceae bacterium]
MAQAILNVRMDENVKKEFDAFCHKAGLNASVAVNMFARAVLRERRIPFEITDETDPFYSENNMRVLLQSIKEADEGKLTRHELIEVFDDE